MKRLHLLLLAAMTLALAGCVKPRTTDTGRSSVEQALLTTAVDRCVNGMSFAAFAGKKVFMDYSLFTPQTDKEYFTGVLETHMAMEGLKVVDKAEDADIKLRVLSAILATNNTELNIGTPAIPIPLPNTDLSFGIPPLSIFARFSHTGTCRMNAMVYDAKTGDLLHAYLGEHARTFYNNWVICMIVPVVTRDVEVPELGKSTWVYWD